MSAVTLRPYQQKAVNAGVIHLRRFNANPSILVLPTGSGKSLVIANIIQQASGRTLVFQPNKEILEQNYGKLIGYGFPEFNVGILSASAGGRSIQHVTYATIGTAINHIEDLKDIKNVIIDECHLVAPAEGQYKALLKAIDAKRVVGLTATPYRMKSYDAFGEEEEAYSKINLLPRERPRYFSDIIHVTQIQELYESKHLCPLVYRRHAAFEPQQLLLNSTGADYDEASMRDYLSTRKYDIVAKTHDSAIWALQCERKSVLAFLPYVEHAAACVEQLKAANVRAVLLTGQTPMKERKAILEGFKRQDGTVQVICNVGVLTTGFDFPELDCIILARPTMSLSLYYQMVGRAMRPHPNKRDALIIDLAGCLRRFGRIEDLRLVREEKYKGWAITSQNRQLTGVALKRISLR